MKIDLINPQTGLLLKHHNDQLIDDNGMKFPIIKGIPRFVDSKNYATSFHFQWDKFAKTQLDKEKKELSYSKQRFFTETLWEQQNLIGENILEVGSGAGRFSKVVLEQTLGNLYSVDYSGAVDTNRKNNIGIAPERFHLFQASVYELPFPDGSFDKAFCFGVLQHTPDFERSVKCIISKIKVGGEIVVDFYPINGWWTKIQSKYILRPITKRISHQRLFMLIEKNIDWLIKAAFFLHRIGLGLLIRFLPICDIKGYQNFYSQLSPEELRELSILDTFDMFSPEHDHPQRLKTVVRMFEKHQAKVIFAGKVKNTDGDKSPMATVVRAIRIS
jgi:ubiquinone/menaquinone biosynthesis C-methylase UbiE